MEKQKVQVNSDTDLIGWKDKKKKETWPEKKVVITENLKTVEIKCKKNLKYLFAYFFLLITFWIW